MRGRIDTRPGLWPAWWTLGVEGEWSSDVLSVDDAVLNTTVGGDPSGTAFPTRFEVDWVRVYRKE